MRRTLILLRNLLALLVILSLVTGAGAFLFVQRTLPQTSGRLEAGGLNAPVEVIRDRWGVPHIYAQNQDDLFFAQGYVMAQDRLWQMEFNRRVAAGRLSEFGGRSTLKDDILLRTLGLYRSAQADAARFPPEHRRVLDAFARGVNTFVETHRDRLPLEFTLINMFGGANLAWEPWTATDTVAIGKVMAMGLSMNMRFELFRAQLRALLGAPRAADLEPSYPQSGPFIVKDAPQAGLDETTGQAALPLAQAVGDAQGFDDLAAAYDRLLTIALSGSLPDAGDSLPLVALGSNNWVVHGNRTVTGKPFLANDPHMGIQNPSIWYEAHLEAPDLRIAGVTFVGVPGVVLGHNARIAWGATNAEVDVQDLYIEKFNPNNARQYEYLGTWEDAQIVREEFRVKGEAEPIVREIMITRHGPIISDSFKERTGDQLALRWTAHEPGTLFQAVFKLWTARNWQEFRDAVRDWDVPAQNLVYADVDGNIGYQMPGRLPIRANGDGAVPVPGWSGAYEWTGWIPFDDLPRAYNPGHNFVASANNRIVDYSYKHFLSNEWAPPYRAQRIEDLITRRPALSIQDMRDIQADVLSIPDRELASFLLALDPANETERRALDLIRRWDFRTTTDSVATSIVETTMSYALHYTFGDELGKLAIDYLDAGVLVLLRLLPAADSIWFDDVTTPGRETRDDVLRRALAAALTDLAQRLGDDMGKWQWGKLHTATFKHQALGSINYADRIFNLGPVGVAGGGGGVTVYAANHNLGKPYAVGNISSLRVIYDLGDFDRSLMVNAVGQSGQPGSKHYGDMIKDWRDVKHHAMPFSRAAVERHKASVLTLAPP